MSTQNLNVSGQDMLLLDNSTSYFQNLGYTRTSNFQFKIKTLDPQNTPNWNATTTYKLQKQDHLLGNLDLRITIALPDQSAIGAVPFYLTNKFAYAMIDRVRFLVGSNLIQELEGEWLDMENSFYREPGQRYVDIVGDARQRPLVRNQPLRISENQAAGMNSAVTIESDRGYYLASRNDEFYGEVEPLMLRTNASNNVQGRVAFVPWKQTATVPPVYKADILPAPAAMPAFTGNKRIQYAHECLTGFTGTDANSLANQSIYSHSACGNPATITFTLPLSFFFTKHPSMYLPIMAIASSQDLTVEVRLKDIGQLLQHYAVLSTAAGSSVTGAAEYKLTTTPQAVSKSTFYPNATPTISTMQLFCHYIALSSSEADALMAKPQHVRLIKQPQVIHNTLVTLPGTYDGTTMIAKTDFVINLSFLHPVQTLWVLLRDPNDIVNNEYFNYYGIPEDPIQITNWDFVINGQSRMPQKTPGDYSVTRLEPLFQNLSRTSYGDETSEPALTIDFALNGQSNNPSGHINLSNAATQQLKLDLWGLAGATYRIDIWAASLNWVNISGGSAKVVFN